MIAILTFFVPPLVLGVVGIFINRKQNPNLAYVATAYLAFAILLAFGSGLAGRNRQKGFWRWFLAALMGALVGAIVGLGVMLRRHRRL